MAPLLAPARYKGAWGGRGSSKSHGFASMAVIAVKSGKRVVCLREIQRSIADSVKQLIEDKILAADLGEEFDITEHEIRHTSTGGLIIFRGLQNHTAMSIKSLEGFEVAWVEEAQTISQKSLDILTPTIRAPGSELWFSWNPVNDTDPIDVFLRSNPPEGSIVIRVNYTDNPWFPDSLRQDMERDKARDPEKFQHVWCGAYQGKSEARVFRNWMVKELSPPDNAVWFYGADWGFATDPTAALRCCLMESVLYIDHEAHGIGIPMERLPALLCEVPGFADWPSRGDSARPETIDYVRRHGIRKMRPAKKGKGSVEHGIEFLKGLDIVVHPRCAHVSYELANYAYKTDRMTGEVLPVLEDKHNHFIDALRYAVERIHRKGKLIEVEAKSLPRRRDYGDNDEDTDSWKTL